MKTAIQETSLRVYRDEVEPTLGKRQKIVYEAFKQKEEWTNSELSSFLGIPINAITPRVFELRQKGLVQEAKRRPCKVTGRTCIAWEIKRENKQVELF